MNPPKIIEIAVLNEAGESTIVQTIEVEDRSGKWPEEPKLIEPSDGFTVDESKLDEGVVR